ncbi:hypothetical protein COL26b_006577 [Colletotrichum chrysophilum]|uniref:uncharacterized protein n=1 Tax=Colletotrichum chrysophilum TaxID=1836956 RepID=UPI002300C2D8|nr:uncharacterized protein COL26b_006577 [Colletotrichum chrysophilum]KAJ0347970.1 hypothetical protein KNSL1_005991 [Colletotrichum chrysophilum]KAJ0375205.1 hypothetical protein COL26b_006577 [Colletotrichum chrysophilum]
MDNNLNLPKRSFKLPFDYPLSQHFKKFSQLPRAVQKMVWTEFYRNPRYFVAKWVQWCELIKHDQDDGKQDDNKADDSDEGCSVEDNYDEYEPEADDSSLMSVSNYFVHHSGWELEPIRTKAHYYDAIDNTIDPMSREVAKGLRPSLRLPVWTCSTEDHLGFWSNTSSHSRATEDPVINFESDFIYIQKTGWPQTQALVSKRYLKWMGSIRNVIIDTDVNLQAGSEDEVRREVAKGITRENLWLWKMRRYLPNLKVIRRALTDKAPQLLNEWAYFQTRYLLREAHDEQWRSTRHDIATDNRWLPGMCSPKEPQWKPFLDSLLGSGATFGCAIPKDLTREDDEVSGSRKLFGGFVQDLVDADATEW